MIMNILSFVVLILHNYYAVVFYALADATTESTNLYEASEPRTFPMHRKRGDQKRLCSVPYKRSIAIDHDLTPRRFILTARLVFFPTRQNAPYPWTIGQSIDLLEILL